MKHRYITIAIILIALALAGGFVTQELKTYLQRRDEIATKQLLIDAVDQCGKIATVAWKNPKDDSTVTEPFIPAYEKCMRDKGY